MKLLIVESPTKARTITKYLGKTSPYKIMASVGHIRDLPKSNKNAIDIKKGFVPHYEIVDKKIPVVGEMVDAAKKAKEILLATDPDREGEAIAWHIAHIIKKEAKKDSSRVVFHEITKEAIVEALKKPRKIDQNLRKAQEARRVLDRLVGYDLSGLIWSKVRYGLSAGRVQSPALRILVEREREIKKFIPQTFWTITATTKNKTNKLLELTCTKEPTEKKEKDLILTNGEKGNWFVSDIKETNAKRSPYPPFTTSTLQQTASTRLGFTPARTMRLAQKLYEAGHITYMRTDSVTLSDTALGQTQKFILTHFGKELFTLRRFKTKSKNAQEAHEAIRPTSIQKEHVGASEDEKKLYHLIRIRTIASQMADAKILKTRITASTKENNIPDFALNGSRTLFAGWFSIDQNAKSEEKEVPKVIQGEDLKLKKIDAEEKETQPPRRYTEAGLVKEMEKRGIGRPSTYASIIKTLDDRGYVVHESRSLIPTETGEVVSTFLEKNFTDYISDSFTAEMEDKLDEIADGKRGYTKTLKDFYTPFSKDVTAKKKEKKLTTLEKVDEKIRCPKCNEKMIFKLGKNGRFMSCAKFPKCDGMRTKEGEEIKPDEPIGTHPETGENIYVLEGPYGPYIQMGEKEKGKPKPKRASIPAETKPESITIKKAVKLLSLPRILGNHPKTNEEITANIGRFGPYIVHNGDFRSLKEDDVYEITFERACEILAQEKVYRKRGRTKKQSKK